MTKQEIEAIKRQVELIKTQADFIKIVAEEVLSCNQKKITVDELMVYLNQTTAIIQKQCYELEVAEKAIIQLSNEKPK